MKLSVRDRCRLRPLGTAWPVCTLVISVALLLTTVAAAPPISQAAAQPPAEQVVQRAWRRAAEAGVYDFATEIVQTVHPAPTVSNVGQSSRRETLYLEGRTNLPQRSMRFRLWREGGGVLAYQDGIEVRVEGDRAWGRRIGSAGMDDIPGTNDIPGTDDIPWQETDDFSPAFAPGRDPMVYLVAAKNVRELGTETRFLPSSNLNPNSGSTASPVHRFARYAFDVHGPSFAVHLRDQLERELRERGELPLGLTLDTSRRYLEMTGEGEVWIDSRGLPLRLTVHLAFPAGRSGEREEADITTDFSHVRGAPPPEVDASDGRRLLPGGHIDLIRDLSVPKAGERYGQLGLLALGVMLVALMVAYRRARRVYLVVVIGVILSMVVGPLLQSQHVAAFHRRQVEKHARADRVRREQEAAAAMASQLTGADWNPHQDVVANHQLASSTDSEASSSTLLGAGFHARRTWAGASSSPLHSAPPTVLSLAANEATAASDLDGDGLTDEAETLIGTYPTVADTDGDTLDDGVELLRLGTAPLLRDSDGDGIYDNVELQGFTFADQHWYLDPLSADTNGDGQLDTVECPDLVALSTRGGLVCADSDGDGVPDVFDRDDDGDGVGDGVDLAPVGLVDRNGLRSNSAEIVGFDREDPFHLKVTDLREDRPVLVDLQLRPTDPAHLGYAFNVLDWPSGDTEGQIQRVKSTTFATTDNADLLNTSDPRASYGDMRLIPMLEISMSGDEVPLALTTPRIDIRVAGEISVTVHLEQASNGANTSLGFEIDGTGDYQVEITEGSCAVPGALQKTFGGVTDGDNRIYTGIKAVELGDGAHAITLSQGDLSACANIGNIVNGPYSDQMIDREPLTPYGISVREANADGDLIAHVPLKVAPDETGGGKAAFSARMVYRVGEGNQWSTAQQVRVIWLVQMLTDGCDQERFQPSVAAQDDADLYDEELTDYCVQPANRTMDDAQVVQTYDESWYLTGLSVREDHGLDVAVAYANSGYGDYPDNEYELWHLARGLGSSFVAGRDGDGDDQRDITVDEIKHRFDLTSTVPVSPTRWNIPHDTLRVETFSYPDQDYAAYLAMKETPRILDGFSHDATPTLLFAREERARSAGLAEGGWSNGVFDVSLGGQEVETVAALSWAPFRYSTESGPDGGVIGWESHPIREYWDRLEVDLCDAFAALFPDESEDAILGRAVVARSFYLSLMEGQAGQVQVGQRVQPMEDPEGGGSDAALAASTGVGYAKKLASVVWDVTKSAYDHYGIKRWYVKMGGGAVDWDLGIVTTWSTIDVRERFVGFWESLGEGIKSNTVAPWMSLAKTGVRGKVAAGVGLAGAVAVVGLTVFAATQAEGVEIAGTVLAGVSAVLAIQGMVSTAVEAINAAKAAGSLTQAAAKGIAEAGKSIKGSVKGAAVVGLIIGVVATWAAFGLQVGLSGGMSARQIGTAVSYAVAATIVVVIMFVISCIPVVGQIIAAVIGLIDALIGLLCMAVDAAMGAYDQEPNAAATHWFCGGITGLVTNLIANLFYVGNVMVELQPQDYERLQFYNFSAHDQVYPELGISMGNRIRYSLGVTNTIDMISPPNNVGSAYIYQYNDGRLRGSTFSYSLNTEEVSAHDALNRGTMTGDWAYQDGDGPQWGDFGHTWRAAEPVYITRNLAHSTGVPFVRAGINVTTSLVLNEAYAIPVQECAAGICWISTERDTNHVPVGGSLIWDVFPATLDEFYTLTEDSALAWGQQGDVTFPALVDADGDGLPAGADPDDGAWDSDGDGLSDLFETELGVSPTDPDSDDDGLSDRLELLVGSDPARPDSDGDGLTDGEEVFHQDVFDRYPEGTNGNDGNGNTTEWVGGWWFAYDLTAEGALRQTWVTSDPLVTDEDGDTLIDFQERSLGFHPRWPSSPQILSLQSQVNEAGGLETDGFVAPGATLTYSATVENELYNRWVQGLLSTEFPTGLDDRGVPPQSFILYPQEEQAISGTVTVTVDGPAASGAYRLTQTASGLVTNWAELAGWAPLWLPFEDPITRDRSGSIPAHDGVCQGTCQAAKGRFGDALELDGSSAMTSGYDPSETSYAVSLWFRTTQADGGLYAVDDPLPDGAPTALYLHGGQVCARVPHRQVGSAVVYQELRTFATYNDDQWHHVVHTFSPDGQALYVDGLEKDSGNKMPANYPSTSGIVIGWTQDLVTYHDIYFQGRIDDVRLFERGLNAAEVEALFDEPVLDMTFDGTSRWEDNSGFGNDGTCSGDACPDHAPGVKGGAAQLDGTQSVSIDGNSALDLSGGRLTFAAWIYPTDSEEWCKKRYHGATNCEIRVDQPQGILGRNSGEPNAYPSLQRVGNKIRFGFGTGSAWESYTSGDVLDPYVWNHVVVTLDQGAMKLYVNGRPRGEHAFAAVHPDSSSRLDIGRSSHQASLLVDHVLVEHPGDGHWSYDGELCIAFRSDGSWQSLLDRKTVAGGAYDVDEELTVDGAGTVRMWEDDGGEHCVTPGNQDNTDPRDDGDDSILSQAFPTSDPSWGSPGTTEEDLGYIFYDVGNTGGEGALFFAYQNDATPFHGKIDEVQIYNKALDAEAIETMYWAGAVHLTFDDPPGETSFRDAGVGRFDAACEGARCPVAGVPGRVNQALRFDGVDDVVTVDAPLSGQGPFAVAAWVKTSRAADQVIVQQRSPAVYNGEYQLSVTADGRLRWMTYGDGEYGFDVTSTATVNDGRWHHVAAVREVDGTGRIYIDGSLDSSESAAPRTLVETTVYVGADARDATAYFEGSIDDIYIFGRSLTAGKVDDLYRAAPIFQLHFDDPAGREWFQNQVKGFHTGRCSGDACPRTGFAIDGQLGTAAQFDGVDDTVTVEDAPIAGHLHPAAFTVGAWVMPTELKDKVQPLLVKSNETGSDRTYALLIDPDSMTVRFSVQKDDCAAWKNVTAEAPLVKDAWNHVMGTFHAGALRLYINGRLQGEKEIDGGVCRPSDTSLRIGGGIPGLAPFAGRLDEVTLYDHALSEKAVRAIYQYQGKWIEERQSHDVTVDADDPTVELSVPYTHWANRDLQLLISAHDETSGIETAELGVRKGSSAFQWSEAVRCQIATGDLWCPTFMPSGEGLYTLEARVTDRVGHQVHSESATLYVDDQAPTVTFDVGSDARVDVHRHPTEPLSWLVHLSGTVEDRPGAPTGSGLDPEGVMVTLHNGSGGVTGVGPTKAVVSGNAWAVDYVLNEANPTGRYTVTVEAADRVATLATLPGDEISAHQGTAGRTIQVDATPPAANLDLVGIPGGVISDTLLLQGDVSERPMPLEMTWTTPDGSGDQVGLELQCADVMLYAAPPGTFPAPTTTRTTSHRVHRGAACRVSTAGTGLTGQVAVCGETVATFEDGGISFTVEADRCAAETAAAGVSGVETAFVRTLPGSPFYNAAGPGGEVLHLPLDDTPDRNGALAFRDISGNGRDGDCLGDRCPSPAQSGHDGASVLFDGVDDRVTLRPVALPDEATFSVWVNPSGVTDAPEPVLLGFDDCFSLGLTNLHQPRWRVNLASGWQNVSHESALSANAWTHLAGTYDGTTLKLYRDGNLVASESAGGAPLVCGGGVIGEGLQGLLDDARVFDRALGADQVLGLYRGSGPLIRLPFDERWAVDGDVLQDRSAWGHRATLHAGPADQVNKMVPGKVGPHTLALDGVDDYVSVEPHPALDLSPGPFTIGVWVYPERMNEEDPVLSSAAYNVASEFYPFMNVDGDQLRYGYGDGTGLRARGTGSMSPIIPRAWNHLALSYNGTTLTAYVNGVQTGWMDVAAPHPTSRFDVGRGIDPDAGWGVPECATITNLRLAPRDFGYRYRIKTGGQVVYETGLWPTPDELISTDIERDFCTGVYLDVDYFDTYLDDWQPMAAYGADHTDTWPRTNREAYFYASGRSVELRYDVTNQHQRMRTFKGRVDDLLIYPRALSAEEIEELFKTGWRAAVLTGGANTDLATWAGEVPEGLEGAYRLDVRGEDGAGHVDASPATWNLWNGEVDTLAPRTWASRATVGDSYRYHVTAVDYNLSEDRFFSPCGPGATAEHTFFQPAWYRSLVGATEDPRLYRLDATCLVSQAASRAQVGRYGTPGPAVDVDVAEVPSNGSAVPYAYVVERLGGLQIVDVAVVSDTKAIGSFDLPGYTHAVAVQMQSVRPAVASARTALTHPRSGGVDDLPRESKRELTPSKIPAPFLGLAALAAAHPSVVPSNQELVHLSLHTFERPAAPALPAAAPDLAVERVEIAPPYPAVNQPFTVTVTIRNRGDADVTGTFRTGVYPGTLPEGCDACGASWDCVSANGLGAGASARLAFMHPGFASPGPQAIYAQVDCDCLVDLDPDLENNIYGPATVIVDAFHVAGTSPPGNGLEIARNSAISVAFSDSVDQATVSTRTFTVRGRHTGLYKGTYAAGSVRFDGGRDYEPGEQVTVNLSDGIKAADGRTLMPHAWQFRAAVDGGTGAFARGQILDSAQSGSWPSVSALGDLDGDGDLDALIGDPNVASMVWINQGGAQGGSEGVHADSGQRLVVTGTQALALGDVDADGDLDTLAACQGTAPNQVWLNDGLAGFTEAGVGLGTQDARAVALGDVDGDGDLDAFLGNGGANQVWLNDGTGVFTDSGQSLGDAHTYAVALGDLDGDGDLDAAVGNHSSSYDPATADLNEIWLNQGGAQGGDLGTFLVSEQVVGEAGWSTQDVDLGDVDGDGDLDVLVAVGDYDQPSTVWLNDGTAAFTYTLGQTLSISSTQAAALGDADGDGDLDAYLANHQQPNSVWLNDGHGVFSDSGQSLGAGEFSADVALGDVDGDGDLDALVVNPSEEGGDQTGFWINGGAARNDQFYVAQDSAGNVLAVLANDVRSTTDPLTLTAVTAASDGTVHVVGDTAVYTPTADYAGSDAFSYTVEDPGGVESSADVLVRVGGSNDPPAAQDDVVTMGEDGVGIFHPVGNDQDADEDTPFLASLGQPSHGTASSVGNVLVYTPSLNYNVDVAGPDVFTYTIKDGTLADSGTISVTVLPVNDPPSFTAGPDQVVAEDAGLHTVSGWAADISAGPPDESGQALHFILSNDNNGLFSAQPGIDPAGTLSFITALDANGSATVWATLHDDGGTQRGGQDSSWAQTIVITVTAVNDPPTAVPDEAVTAQGTPVRIDVMGGADNDYDVDGDSLLIVAVGVPQHGTASIDASFVIYTPTQSFVGPDLFTYTVADPHGLTDTAAISVTVTDIDDPPTIDRIPDVTTLEDGGEQVVPLTGISAGPGDSQPLIVTAVSTDTSLIPHPITSYTSPQTTGSLAFTAEPHRYGQATIEVTVDDRTFQTTESFTVTVEPVNDPPTLDPVADVSTWAGAGEQTVALGGITAGPFEDQALSVVAVSTNTAVVPHPTVDYVSPRESGTLRFTPADQVGVAGIDVVVSDGLSQTTRSFQVHVQPPEVRTFAYVANEAHGLRALDVTDPANVTLADTHDFGAGAARDVVVSDTLAYVAHGPLGLDIIDVSNPANPERLGRCTSLAGDAQGVAVSGNYAYVAVGEGGIEVVDVSVPTSPVRVARLDTPDIAEDVTVDGDYAYVADVAGGLRVIDVSVPTSPQEAGHYRPARPSATGEYARQVVVVGDYAYVASWYGGLRIVDVSTPSDPQPRGRCCGYPDIATGVAVVGDRAYLVGTGGLSVVDVGDPDVPAPIGGVTWFSSWLHAIAVSGDYAYVGDSEGLQVVHLSDERHPAPGRRLDVGAGSGVALAGSHAYVAASYAGLVVASVGDPANPTKVGTYAVPMGRAKDVTVSGDYAFVAAFEQGLKIVDVSNPWQMKPAGSYEPGGQAIGVTLVSASAADYAYLALGNDGVHIVDVTDPEAPRPVDVVDTLGFARDVAVLQGASLSDPTYALVAHGWHLEVFDVSDLATGATRITSLQLPSSPQAVIVSPSGMQPPFALVSCGDGGLVKVDLSSSQNPFIWRVFETEGYAESAEVGPPSSDLDRFGFVAASDAGLEIVDLEAPTDRLVACDTANNCTVVVPETVSVAAFETSGVAQAESDSLLVEIGGVPPLLDTTEPISVTGLARAESSTLVSLTLTLDGTLLCDQDWSGQALTETLWSTSWVPGEGPHLLEATAWDAAGATASDRVSVTVDTIPPLLAVTPRFITGTHYHEPRTVDVSGLVTDTGGVATVWVGAAGPGETMALSNEAALLDAAGVPFTAGGWRTDWYLGAGELPDNVNYRIGAEATDRAGHRTRVTETVTVDVVPPASVNLSMRSDGQDVAPFDEVTGTAPTLTLAWTPSSDGSGLNDYLVRWTAQTTRTSQVDIARTASLSATHTPGNGQKVSVDLGCEDTHGQQTWQRFGPVYVDAPTTPDLVPLEGQDTYLGWMGSGCSLIGVDRRVARHAPGSAALSAEQRLYGTWNSEALRLAWTGASWSTDGDLFVYLDSGSGGATEAFDPYGTTTVSLPDGMGADSMVWVRDEAHALLLTWNVVSSTWDFETLLGPGEYQFRGGLNGGHTDLYLPFDLIGVSAGGDLDLLAFASQEGALGLWATLPPANPVTSGRATAMTAYAGDERSIDLTHRYHWDALVAGVCPNGSDAPASAQAILDTDVEVRLTPDPAGTSYSLLGDNLFWLQDLLKSAPADVTSHLDFLNSARAPVGDGQTISYTLSYRNRGTDTAYGVFADVMPLYALSLLGGNQVALGDIGPGAEGEVTFQAVVSTSLSAEPWAAVEVKLHDAAHPASGEPLDWLWAHHPVDGSAPQFFGIEAPSYLLRRGDNRLRGYAYDAGHAGRGSGVSLVDLDVQGRAGLACRDDGPADGGWSCIWDVTASHGDVLSATLHATDGFGQGSAWGAPLPFLVDAMPPAVTLDLSATQSFVGGGLTRGGSSLYGDVADDGGLGKVEVCVTDHVSSGPEGACAPAVLQLIPRATAVTVDDAPGTPVAIDGAAICADPIVRTFHVTRSFDIAQVSLGFVAEHVRRDDLQVKLTSPSGTVVRVLYDDGLSGTAFRHYDVWLNDAAPMALVAAQADHDPTAPFFDRFVRPYEPLRAFQGQGSAGDWTLTICDLNPSEHDGTYLRSRLTLTPRDTASKAGRWGYRVPAPGDLDYVARTVSVYAEDVLGNRTQDPLTRTFVVDNVPPVITVSAAISQMVLGETETVLQGQVTDGGPSVKASVQVSGPDGVNVERGAARNGDSWWFDLSGDTAGRYTLWVVARDAAGNSAEAGPFTVDVGCTAAELHTAFLSAEPAAGHPFSVTLTAVISNAGAGTVGAGLPVGFYADGERIGTAVTAGTLAPQESETVSMLWSPVFYTDYDITIRPNDSGPNLGAQTLCTVPDSTQQAVTLLDVRLTAGWNLMSTYVEPFNRDIGVVQRPIDGQYVVIMGFEQGARSFYPNLPPGLNTLHEMDALHGYWVKTTNGQLRTDASDEEPWGTALWVVGEPLPEDHPIGLDPGWNLVSYLPRTSQPVTVALASIAGKYEAVLGFDQGALSYYPDLPPEFNTLHVMAPRHGYWIRATEPVTLVHSTTTRLEPFAPGNRRTAGSEETIAGAVLELDTPGPWLLGAEREVGVAPTNAWMNVYGPAQGSDGTPLPPGAMVEAVDPDGVVCGAVRIAVEGQYGLLPCYGDDPTTPEDEGAEAGDIIHLVVDGAVLGQATWTGHGERQRVDLGGSVPSPFEIYLPLIIRGTGDPRDTAEGQLPRP